MSYITRTTNDFTPQCHPSLRAGQSTQGNSRDVIQHVIQHHWPLLRKCQADFRACLSGLPLVGWVELHGQHVQCIPGSDADSPEQAEQSNHGRFTVAKGQEETADAGDHTGARWRETNGRGGKREMKEK